MAYNRNGACRSPLEELEDWRFQQLKAWAEFLRQRLGRGLGLLSVHQPEHLGDAVALGDEQLMAHHVHLELNLANLTILQLDDVLGFGSQLGAPLAQGLGPVRLRAIGQSTQDSDTSRAELTENGRLHTGLDGRSHSNVDHGQLVIEEEHPVRKTTA